VDRYSFLVRLLPPLLHAGLSRRTKIPIALKMPGAGGSECNALISSIYFAIAPKQNPPYFSRAILRMISIGKAGGAAKVRPRSWAVAEAAAVVVEYRQ
jgi:hypothetical protein